MKAKLLMVFCALVLGLGTLPTMASAILNGQFLVAPSQTIGTPTFPPIPAVNGEWLAYCGGGPLGGYLYIFQKQAGTWQFFQAIQGVGGNGTIRISTNAIFVAEPSLSNPLTGGNDGGVLVYTLSGSTWMQSQIIYPWNETTPSGGGFGQSLSIVNSTLYVGYQGYISPYGVNTGEVEAWDVSSIPATYLGQLLPNPAYATTGFGSMIAASGNVVTVGAANEGMPGFGAEVGAVYTFAQSGSSWTQTDILFSPTPHAKDGFGGSPLWVDGGRVLVANENYNSQAPGGPQGVGFSYTAAAGGYMYESSFSPALGFPSDLFGASLVSSSGQVIVGAPGWPAGISLGKLFAYRNVQNAWQDVGSFTTSGLATNSQFGGSLATDGSTLVVGAYGRGSVYVFNLISDYIFVDGFEP